MSATSAPASAPETARDEFERVGQAEFEPKEAEETNEQTLTPAHSAGETEDDAESARQAGASAGGRGILAERIRQAVRLPAGLRARLAELVEAPEAAESIDAALGAVADALPAALRIDERSVRRPGHPGGAAFFSRETGELSDDEAERIAREQLARAGLLRGQRVRVGD
jgi:hypothetical protein